MAAGEIKRTGAVCRATQLGEGVDRTDGQLLEHFQSHRDEAAFTVLVERHGPMVMGVCRRLLRNEQDAEDACQAVFMVLVRKMTSLMTRPTVGDWLYGVAYRTALKARTSTARRRFKESQVVMANPRDTEVLWPDLQPLLDQELGCLPEKYRVPIILCDLEGKTRREAARLLDWPEGTVSGRLSRAHTMLRRRLARRGLLLSGGGLALALVESAAQANVSAPFAAATVAAATDVVSGRGLAGAVSAPVAALTEGVIRAMLMTKLKIALTVLLTLGALGVSVGWLAVHSPVAAQTGESDNKDKNQKNNKDDGDKNQKNDGQKNNKDDGDKNQKNGKKEQDTKQQDNGQKNQNDERKNSKNE